MPNDATVLHEDQRRVRRTERSINLTIQRMEQLLNNQLGTMSVSRKISRKLSASSRADSP